MRGAIIGFGKIASGHLAAYAQMEGVFIEAVVDPVPERQECAVESLPNINVYSDVNEMLKKEKVDFIDICSPPNTHDYYMRVGLSNNCHVLCEKPFLLSTKQFGGLLSLSQSVNKIVYPCHNYKFSPACRFLYQFVASGRLGEILKGHFRTFRDGHALGVSQWKPNWRRDPAISGGGILQDHGTHSIYLAYHICGRPPSSVSCVCGNLKADDRFSDTEDTALLAIDFDGINWDIDLSWAAGLRNTYYSIVGSREAIIVENDNVKYTHNSGETCNEIIASDFDDPSHKSWFRELFNDFRSVVNNPDIQVSLLLEALVTSLVLESAYLSASNKGVWTPVPRPSIDYLL